MARSSLRLGVGRRTCPSAAPLDKATLRRKLALAFRYAHPRKCIGAPDEPSDATARRLKCPESNASNQKAFDTKCIRSGGAGFGSFALRSAYNPLVWHPEGLALSEEQSRGTARFQTDNGGLHDRPRPVQATSATSTRCRSAADDAWIKATPIWRCRSEDLEFRRYCCHHPGRAGCRRRYRVGRHQRSGDRKQSSGTNHRTRHQIVHGPPLAASGRAQSLYCAIADCAIPANVPADPIDGSLPSNRRNKAIAPYGPA